MFFSPLILLIAFWLTRLPALALLPLHNDEGLHLTRAIEVWNLHPFWEIGDGKIINHWLIAAFYPQNAPDFVGRYATLLVGIIGLVLIAVLCWRKSRALLLGLVLPLVAIMVLGREVLPRHTVMALPYGWSAELIASYPRPHETVENAAVVLWRINK